MGNVIQWYNGVMLADPATIAPPSMFRYHIHEWRLAIADDWLMDADSLADHIIAVCLDPKCGKVLSRNEIEARLNRE